MELSGLGALLLLVADVYAAIMTWQSRAQTGEKVLWLLVLFFLPLVGLVLWYFWGPGKKPF